MDRPTTEELFEQSIEDAIANGGRNSSAALLRYASGILRGELPLSPALAQWFTEAIERIGNDESADVAFGTKRRKGSKPIRSGEQDAISILDRVNAARAEGYPTKENRNSPSCFHVAAESLGLSEDIVRKRYYDWEVVDEIVFEVPPALFEHQEHKHHPKPLTQPEVDALALAVKALSPPDQEAIVATLEVIAKREGSR
ncbi:hypothetical protein [Halochromatium roseum]|uniref:hypothetical protein n=1 Tax=Halochromatium roseum TaxID=391920 RepID=UPI00191370C0|nr:hypothetical protein [Halochromatium roseum]MBK5941432.1 hypothetical protein [Halochromatium roseum]